MSSYMMWFNANRNDIKEKNPDAAFLDISKIGGDLWRALEASEKAVSKWEKNYGLHLQCIYIFFIFF